ncbi:MAG: hypothetical protein L6R19_15950 [Alphaproteobacteria bacterium]|nr:hypothetical protein [Alphaproteobacteria bacterium]
MKTVDLEIRPIRDWAAPRVPSRPKHRFTLYSTPTRLQQAAFTLLGFDPVRVQ